MPLSPCRIAVAAAAMTIACAAVAVAADQPEPAARPSPITYELVMRDELPHLSLTHGDRILVAPDHGALHVGGGCAVKVSATPTPEGVTITYLIANPSAEQAELPRLQIPGITLPMGGETRHIDNWKLIQWRQFGNPGKVGLHPARTYPCECYSPVLGLRDGELCLGVSMIHDVFALRREVHPNYSYDAKSERWTMWYQFRAESPPRKADEPRRFPPAVLAPGEEMTVHLAVGVAPATGWLAAFRAYREHFQASFGAPRYQRLREPIYALSMASGNIFGTADRPGQVSDENPRGYNPESRLDLHGFKIYPPLIKERVQDRGFRRVMLWQIAGVYRHHRNTNMVWEITSAWTKQMQATVEQFRQVIADGVVTGLWMGRMFAISGGFDSGLRHPWDPDNPADNALAFRELDRAYELGVRIIGGDAIPKGLHPTHWSPSSEVGFKRIFPMLHRRYPDMRYIVETAACDYLHLMGGSFIWDAEVNGPFEFAEFIAPGVESHAVMKRGRMANETVADGRSVAPDWQARFEELIKWGYTPIVFCEQGGQSVRVPRELLERQP